MDVLKVAHHGAKGTTSKEFLQKIKPTYAIISAGNNKNYNHPDETILKRLIDEGIKQENIYITKNQGTIWLKSNGSTITIETRLVTTNLLHKLLVKINRRNLLW